MTTKQVQFESQYKHRLQLLLYRYCYENSGNVSIPNVLLKTIQKWYHDASNEPKLNLNLITRSDPIFYEIYLDKTANKILPINSYRLKLKPDKDQSYDIIKWKSEIRIYDDDEDYKHGAHFIGIGKLILYNYLWLSNMRYNIKLTAYDKQNNILIRLVTKFTLKLPQVPYYHYYEPSTIIRNFELIDTKNKGFVNLNEWMDSMFKLNNNNNNFGARNTDYKLIIYKRLYYFIYHNYNVVDINSIFGLMQQERNINDNHSFKAVLQILRC